MLLASLLSNLKADCPSQSATTTSARWQDTCLCFFWLSLLFSPFSLSLFLFLFVLFVCFVFEYDCDLDSPSTSHSRARQHNGSHCLHFTCTRVASMMFYFSCQRTDPRIWLLLLALGPKIRFEQDSEKFCLVSFSFLVSFPFRVEMFARFARGC